MSAKKLCTFTKVKHQNELENKLQTLNYCCFPLAHKAHDNIEKYAEHSTTNLVRTPTMPLPSNVQCKCMLPSCWNLKTPTHRSPSEN